jgi:hypothetical protein
MTARARRRVVVSASVIPTAAVSAPLGQEIVGRATDRSAEGVEVGVQRGLRVDGRLGTLDSGLPARNPSIRGSPVESLVYSRKRAKIPRPGVDSGTGADSRSLDCRAISTSTPISCTSRRIGMSRSMSSSKSPSQSGFSSLTRT